MLHDCSKDGFTCSALSQFEEGFLLEALFAFDVGENARWTGELTTTVPYCPFCGKKFKGLKIVATAEN
jgi:hypothetical protein